MRGHRTLGTAVEYAAQFQSRGCCLAGTPRHGGVAVMGYANWKSSPSRRFDNYPQRRKKSTKARRDEQTLPSPAQVEDLLKEMRDLLNGVTPTPPVTPPSDLTTHTAASATKLSGSPSSLADPARKPWETSSLGNLEFIHVHPPTDAKARAFMELHNPPTTHAQWRLWLGGFRRSLELEAQNAALESRESPPSEKDTKPVPIPTDHSDTATLPVPTIGKGEVLDQSLHVRDRVRSLMRLATQPVVVCTSGTMPQVDTQLDGMPLPLGLTVSSFTSVCLSPRPIVSFNIALPSRTQSQIDLHRSFLIHVLAPTTGGVRVAKTYSNHPNLRPERAVCQLEQASCRIDQVMVGDVLHPMLMGPNILYVLKCSLLKWIRVEDHMVVFGHVEDILPGGGAVDRESFVLSYADGEYRLPSATVDRKLVSLSRKSKHDSVAQTHADL